MQIHRVFCTLKLSGEYDRNTYAVDRTTGRTVAAAAGADAEAVSDALS